MEKRKTAQREAEMWMYEELTEVSVEQWLSIWLDEYCRHVKRRSLDKYRSTVKQHLIPALGDVKLSELNKIQVQRAMNRLGDGVQPCSAKSIHDIHGILHRALQQAVEVDIMERNPSDHCRLPRVEKSEMKPMNKQQIRMFMEESRSSRYGDLFVLDLLTGLRMGEVLALSWDCVDFDKGFLRIYRQLHQVKGGYVFGSLKNGRTRYVPLPSSALILLRKQYAQQGVWRGLLKKRWSNEEDLIFTNEAGRHLAPNTVRTELHRITRRMGITGFRFHDLRHSYATLCLSEGVDIKTLQSNLGHHSAAFTMEQYVHCTDEMKQASARCLESFVQRVNDM